MSVSMVYQNIHSKQELGSRFFPFRKRFCDEWERNLNEAIEKS